MLTGPQLHKVAVATSQARSGTRMKNAEQELRAAAAKLLDVADELGAERDAPPVYVVPVDPADATICEACE